LPEAFEDLSKALSVDLRYHYQGPKGALRWIALCEDPAYGHVDLAKAIDSSFSEIVGMLESIIPEGVIDFVSLGPGDGEIDGRILSQLVKSMAVGRYYCLDSSFELLRYAVNRVLKKHSNQSFAIRAICGDFTKKSFVSLLENNGVPNLFGLTGYTMGNYSETTLLSALRAAMSSRDYLFLDARLHSLKDWDGKRALTVAEKKPFLSNYAQKAVDRFVFGPAETACDCSVEDVIVELSACRKITRVPMALNLILFCRDFSARMELTGERVKKQRLELASTTLYSYEPLKTWLLASGFDVVWSSQSEEIGLFLLKRNDAS
jgi:hypothetical protein